MGNRGQGETGGKPVAVGIPVARHPPHRSVRELQLIRLLPRMNSGQAHFVRLAAPDPAPGTRLPAAGDGPSGPRPRSPWRGRFPPDSPPAVPRPCSNRSSVLPPATTPVQRTRGAYGLRLPPPACPSRQASPRSPGSRARSFLTCTGSPTAPGPHAACDDATIDIAFPFCPQGRHPNLSISRLHRRPASASVNASPATSPSPAHDSKRGSLLLHCGALSSPTPRRFIPALSGSPDFSRLPASEL